ncbi:hypothetical protein BDQ17DRAFT_1422356 [Cyathus striatus]|nr:hypothetical protein BDQ17DRAFT_1422356 [Cyathus striatus]
MRPLLLLTIPALLFGAVSSLVIPAINSVSAGGRSCKERSTVNTDISDRDRLDVDKSARHTYPIVLGSPHVTHANFPLEGRARKPKGKSENQIKKQQAMQKPKVKFGQATRNHLDKLDIHGKDRKTVKNFYKNVVKQHLAKTGANSAQLKFLAHDIGTVD